MKTQAQNKHMGRLLRTIRKQVKQGLSEGEDIEIIKDNAVQSEVSLSAYEELVAAFIDANIEDWTHDIESEKQMVGV